MMNITNTHAYAVDILLTVAAEGGKNCGVVSSARIADMLGLARDYVTQVAAKLVQAGFLKVQRGVKGGYILDVSLNVVTVADVVRACDKGKTVPDCVSLSPAACKAFKRARDGYHAVLDAYELSSLLPGFKSKVNRMVKEKGKSHE